MATIKEVAEVAGVSIATVSRVLNNTAPVNEATKKKIQEAIQQLNYVPSTIARGMRKQQSHIIGMIIPDYENPYYTLVYKYLEQEANKRDYRLVVACMEESKATENTSVLELMARNVDGIVLCTYYGNEKSIKGIMELSQSIPILFLDNFPMEEHISSVIIDGYKGMRAIAEHVIGLGHERIGYIDRIFGYKVADDRKRAYEETLKDYSIPLAPELIYRGSYTINSGYEAAKYFMEELKNAPTAILASNDAMAIGVIGYLREHGYKVPEEVAVTGFDDVYLSKISVPPITTYHQPLEKIAHVAMDILVKKIKTRTKGPYKVIIEGELIKRESTGYEYKKNMFPI